MESPQPQIQTTLKDSLTPDSLKLAELNHILHVIRKYRGNKTTAAKALGISRETLYRKIRRGGK